MSKACCASLAASGYALCPRHATGMSRPLGFESPAQKRQRPRAGARSNLAESWGVEPQKGFAALTRLAGEHLRPLGQLSVC